MTTHLDVPGRSLNSRTKKIRCTIGWHCKRMTCNRCTRYRRQFFIDGGVVHALAKGLSTFVTVSWLRQPPGESWIRLGAFASRLSKVLSGMKAGPFIRVACLGETRATPHIHFLVGARTAKLIDLVAHKRWPGKVSVQIKEAHDIEGLLGYFFDQNFRPSYLDPDRVKGIRLLSASRPMKTGFPTKRQVIQLAARRSMLTKKDGHIGNGFHIVNKNSTGNWKEGSMIGEINPT